DMYSAGSVLSEAYLNYAFGKTNVKVGRQFIGTPLLAGSGSRIIVQSFEGLTVVNTDLPQTTLTAAVVTKFAARTDGAGAPGKFDELSVEHDKAYTFLAVNKSIPNVTLTAQYLTIGDSGTAATDDGYKDIYLEIAYASKAGSFDYGLAANYLNTNYDLSTKDSGTMYGVMANMGKGDLKGFIAYSVVGDDGSVVNGIGSAAQPMYAKGVSYFAGYYNDDSKSVSVDVNYNFKAIGLLAGARYTDVKDDNAASTADKFGITDFYATYTVQQLKGLSFGANYQSYSKDAEGRDIWFKVNYKF
ncbi:MAG: OprD family outer membrane porin, partial [Sulfurospirillaceae bacterium]|nr:OprD family outer membrane porin [Sulfurospirillaceae bacterium]